MTRLALAFGWGPDYYENLTECQIYGYSTNIGKIERYQAEVNAVAIARRIAPEIVALMFGKGKT